MSVSSGRSVIPHRRWWIGMLLGPGILVNYA